MQLARRLAWRGLTIMAAAPGELPGVAAKELQSVTLCRRLDTCVCAALAIAWLPGLSRRPQTAPAAPHTQAGSVQMVPRFPRGRPQLPLLTATAAAACLATLQAAPLGCGPFPRHLRHLGGLCGADAGQGGPGPFPHRATGHICGAGGACEPPSAATAASSGWVGCRACVSEPPCGECEPLILPTCVSSCFCPNMLATHVHSMPPPKQLASFLLHPRPSPTSAPCGARS